MGEGNFIYDNTIYDELELARDMQRRKYGQHMRYERMWIIKDLIETFERELNERTSD